MIGSLLRERVAALRAVPSRIHRIEALCESMARAWFEVKVQLEHPIQPVRPVDPTYVYVLGAVMPDGIPPMMVQSVRVGYPRERVQLCFDAYGELPAGLWVVAVGPASVRGVRVGNKLQTTMGDINGQVCRTTDLIPQGVHLIVELEAPNHPPTF